VGIVCALSPTPFPHAIYNSLFFLPFSEEHNHRCEYILGNRSCHYCSSALHTSVHTLSCCARTPNGYLLSLRPSALRMPEKAVSSTQAVSESQEANILYDSSRISDFAYAWKRTHQFSSAHTRLPFKDRTSSAVV
jgi:hypothetical protein